MTRKRSFDRPRDTGHDQPATGRLVVFEGMPGAGKTSIAQAFADEGRCVLGEYTTVSTETMALDRHPEVADDDAHQANWLRKTDQARRALRCGHTVFADRDWLSSLSYAYSTGDKAMLAERLVWAVQGLQDGRLIVADAYIVFRIGPATSMQRRADRLRPGHPWSNPDALRLLARFYRDPAHAVGAFHPWLGRSLSEARWEYVSGHDDQQDLLRRIRDLGEGS